MPVMAQQSHWMIREAEAEDFARAGMGSSSLFTASLVAVSFQEKIGLY